MEIYLKHLVLAFANVELDYFSSLAFGGGRFTEEGSEEERKEYTQYVERVFAYELYHQYRLIMENKENKEYYYGLKLNAEITKNGFNETILGKQYIFPDMVLHHSQTDNSFENQKMFIEIKANQHAKIEDDLKKMQVAVSERLNYQSAIFIAISHTHNSLTSMIEKYFNSSTNEMVDKTKFWLLTKEYGLQNFTELL
jgi:hypothetical protein